MPRVSVIIPTYNRSPMLKEAICSVLSQTYHDLEVLVVDDGSSDDTAEVVQNFDDQRVRYLYQENSGRSAARNHGMKVATGDFLSLLDDDDYYFPHKLACQIAYLEANSDVDMVASGFQSVNRHGKLISIRNSTPVEPELTLLSYLKRPMLITSSITFRKTMSNRLSNWFCAEHEPAEDADFFIRLLHAGCRTHWLPEVVSAYRLHDRNSSVIGYDRSFKKVLSIFFSRPDVPPVVMAQKKQIYLHFYLVAAARAYAVNQVNSAQFKLLQALMVDPEMVKDRLPAIVAGLIRTGKADPQGFVDFVFQHLPSPAVYLKKYQREALSLATREK